MGEENWRPVIGYEGAYEVSDLGRIKSLNAYGRGIVKVLKQKESNRGYLTVDLFKDGKYTKLGVHRIVCSAFVRPPKGNEQVNHIDGDKKNNLPSNLEWCTPSENIKHAYRTGLKEKSRENMRRVRKEHDAELKAYQDQIKRPVIVTRIDTGESTEYESVNAAARGTGVSPANVNRVLKGEYKQGKGFKFKYKEEKYGSKDAYKI